MSFKKIIMILLCLKTGSALAQDSLNLNKGWKFALAKTDIEAKALSNFHEDGYKPSSFKPTIVPSNWAVLGYEEPVYRGFEGDKASEGFYILDFEIPQSWKERNTLIHFDGVWSSAEVWLNGILVGDHHGGYTSFAFNIGNKLKIGQKNRLAVRVRQVNRDYKFDVYDDWTLGGIYRDVWLEGMPSKRWINSSTLVTDFDNNYKNAQLKIKTMVSDRNKETLPGNYPSPGEPYTLRYTLLNAGKEKVCNRDVLVPAHTATDREVSLVMQVDSPRPWTAETPNLYSLRVELIENGKVVQTRSETVGFREISTSGGVFRINGQAVKLRGVNRHDEHPDVGRATTARQWLEDIKLMKEANINYVRMAHYSHAKGFIELCDRMGMYVGEEVSLGGAGDLMDDPSFSDAVFQRSYETITRDLNNPSIIYWSVGNEDALTSLHLAAVKFVKALDPSRPILLPWRAEEWLPKEVDILAPHYWKPQEYDQLAAHSDRPVISTEYTHSFGIDGFGGLASRWKALTKHPSGAGAAVWMWADQGIKTPVPRPKTQSANLSAGDEYLRIDEAGWDGIVDSYRRFTRDYWETKAVYAPVYPALDAVQFTPGERFVRIPVQNDFDFTDLNELTISWTIYEDGKELSTGSGKIQGLPHNESAFMLPTDQIKKVQAGKTYYVWMNFKNTGGFEINRRAVELITNVKTYSTAASTSPQISDNETSVNIMVGDFSYIFNPKIGQLAKATFKTDNILTGLRPTIWRTPDRSEMSVIGKKEVAAAADLSQFKQTVLNWRVNRNQTNTIINSQVEYLINDKNKFTVSYIYTIGNDGTLHVNYQILTKVTVPSLPIVGMVAESDPNLKDFSYLGLGPYNSYPNKQTAPILGVWTNENLDTIPNMTKLMRWVEKSGSGRKVRIFNKGYLEYNKNKPNQIYLLSGVLGRPEKGRKADESIPQLQTNTNEPFVGEFTIQIY